MICKFLWKTLLFIHGLWHLNIGGYVFEILFHYKNFTLSNNCLKRICIRLRYQKYFIASIPFLGTCLCLLRPVKPPHLNSLIVVILIQHTGNVWFAILGCSHV